MSNLRHFLVPGDVFVFPDVTGMYCIPARQGLNKKQLWTNDDKLSLSPKFNTLKTILLNWLWQNVVTVHASKALTVYYLPSTDSRCPEPTTKDHLKTKYR